MTDVTERWYEGITKQDFVDAVNQSVTNALRSGVNAHTADYEELVKSHLKLWADSGIPAPLNEAQSIQGWLRFMGTHTKEETLSALRHRMLLLEQTARDVFIEGPEEEKRLGIYENRPDLDPANS